MRNIKISYKSKTNLITKLLEQENIVELKKQSIFSKLVSSKKEFADIYFHSGSLDEQSIKNIENAKLIIVNSQSLKHKVILQTNIEPSKIEVIYPSIDINYEKPKTLKKQLCKNFEIDSKKKIIFFTAKNFKSSGVKEFIHIIAQLTNDNYHVIIAGDSKQITTLKFQMSKINLFEHISLLENYKNIDELFLITDIFILPTYNQNFATNILKAMFCKCAVFVPSLNYSNELVDVFSTMDEPDDRSIPFKINALLLNEDDLRQIKKENRKKALEYTLEKNLLKIKALISKI